MSYCRWGLESNCYIFHHADGFLTCLGCLLMKGPDEVTGDHPSFSTTSRTEMLVHVQEHRRAGHLVPERVDLRLLEELNIEGDEVGDGLRSEDPPADEGAGGANPAGADEGSSP